MSFCICRDGLALWQALSKGSIYCGHKGGQVGALRGQVVCCE